MALVLTPGMVLDGRFRVERPIAEGGMGAVYEATRVDTGRRVALKVMRDKLAADEVALERFRREARVLRDVGHPAIVGIEDAGVLSDGMLYLALELLDGETLQARLRRKGPMTPAELLPIVLGLCDALAQAHARGVVHRDLKPSNVFLPGPTEIERARATGQVPLVKLLDFGVAKVLGEQLTRTGLAIGTLRYMAPEQLEGHDVDGRADVYSLGVVMFLSLSGRHPLRGVGDGLLRAILLGKHDRLADVADVSEAVSAVVARAMAPRRDDRHASMGALSTAFTLAVQGSGARSGGTLRGVGVPPAAAPDTVDAGSPSTAPSTVASPGAALAPPTVAAGVLAPPTSAQTGGPPVPEPVGAPPAPPALTAQGAVRPRRGPRRGLLAAGVAVLAALAGAGVSSIFIAGQPAPEPAPPVAVPPVAPLTPVAVPVAVVDLRAAEPAEPPAPAAEPDPVDRDEGRPPRPEDRRASRPRPPPAPGPAPVNGPPPPTTVSPVSSDAPTCAQVVREACDRCGNAAARGRFCEPFRAAYQRQLAEWRTDPAAAHEADRNCVPQLHQVRRECAGMAPATSAGSEPLPAECHEYVRRSCQCGDDSLCAQARAALLGFSRDWRHRTEEGRVLLRATCRARLASVPSHCG